MLRVFFGLQQTGGLVVMPAGDIGQGIIGRRPERGIPALSSAPPGIHGVHPAVVVTPKSIESDPFDLLNRTDYRGGQALTTSIHD